MVVGILSCCSYSQLISKLLPDSLGTRPFQHNFHPKKNFNLPLKIQCAVSQAPCTPGRGPPVAICQRWMGPAPPHHLRDAQNGIRIWKPIRHCFPITANTADNAGERLSFPPWEGLWIGCSTEVYCGLLLFCLCLLMFHLCILLDLLQSVIAQAVQGTQPYTNVQQSGH